jgi:hypothetical protein
MPDVFEADRMKEDAARALAIAKKGAGARQVRIG